MGCSTSAPVKKEEAAGEHVDVHNIEEEKPEYPLPYIPQTSKSEIWDLETNQYIQDRIDEMPQGTEGSYKTLLKYLSDGTTKEIHHVTAIYLWMKCQDYESEDLDQNEFDQQNQKSARRGTTKQTRVDPNDEAPPDTPRGYMKMIKDGKGDFSTFFTILCRRSNIPCNIIRGLGKDEKFHIGMSEQHMSTKWTAVYVDQEWRLSHIQWAMEHRTDRNQNMTKDNISDFYFLMDPDDFAFFCHPDDFNWQLMDRPYSKREFLAMPNYRPASFFMDMAAIIPKQATTKTTKVKTEIEISFPRKLMEETEVSFEYKYHQELAGQKNETRASKTSLPGKLGTFVFVNRKPTKFIFEIQLPAAGKYLFDIHAKHFKKDDSGGSKSTKSPAKSKKIAFERLVQFRLISELDPEEGDVEPYPDDPEHGWGPGPSCRQYGLVPLTHFDSYIFIKPGEFRDIRFRMKSKLEVQCQLTHHYLPIYQLVEQIEQETTENEVSIRVQVPEEGTYALKIYCRPKGTKEYNETCVYLLKQQVPSRLPENFERGYRRKYRDKMIRSRLEHHTENHTTEKELADAIEMYHCYNVPDHGELKRANDKLKHYWEIKRELNLATKGRNINNVKKWLEKAKRSKYRDDIKEDIRRAEQVEDGMTKRKGYAHPIAKMDEQTITEIHNYKRPPKVVHDVMKSTYILLGQEAEDLDTWEHIQYLMGRTGQDGLKKIILNRKVEDVSLQEADEAEVTILPYNLDKCRAVSTGIGSFYKWNNHMIQGVNQRDMSNTARMEAEQELMERPTFREDYEEIETDTVQTNVERFVLVDDPTENKTDETNSRQKSANKELEISSENPQAKVYTTNKHDDAHEELNPISFTRSTSTSPKYSYEYNGAKRSETITPVTKLPSTASSEPMTEEHDDSQLVSQSGFKHSMDDGKSDRNGKHRANDSPDTDTPSTNGRNEGFSMIPIPSEDAQQTVKPISYTGFKQSDPENDSLEDISNTTVNTLNGISEVDTISDIPFKGFTMIPASSAGNNLKPISYRGFKPSGPDNDSLEDISSTTEIKENPTNVHTTSGTPFKGFTMIPASSAGSNIKPISKKGFKRSSSETDSCEEDVCIKHPGLSTNAIGHPVNGITEVGATSDRPFKGFTMIPASSTDRNVKPISYAGFRPCDPANESSEDEA